MKLSEYIKELEKIMAQRGDCEFAIECHGDSNRHQKPLGAQDRGLLLVVEDRHGYPPVKVVNKAFGGFTEPYRSRLQELPQKEVLLINMI